MTRPEEVDQLFGFANETSSEGKAGMLIFHDAPLTNYEKVVRYHNAIDRFTGGVIQGALFTEELLEYPEFEIKITAKVGATISSIQQQALKATFDDIELGLLPIGGGSGRGHSLTQRHGTWHIDWEQLTVTDHIPTAEGAN